MATILISEFEDTFVVHFGTEGERVNAYTLATALINLADTAKAANATINPGYEIEVVVEALGGGSFRAKVRTIYQGAANLFSQERLQAIVLAVIANFVYQHTLAPDSQVEVRIFTDEVLVQQGETRIVVPRNVHDATQQVERSPRFRSGIAGVMRTLEADPAITAFGFSPHPEDPTPPVEIPRHRFPMIPTMLEEVVSDSRELIEITDLEILRAILERSSRRWQFAWGGMRISAPVFDDSFYDKFFAHEITIAPGDRLRVKLKVKQRRLPDVGIYINEGYEVCQVLEHIPRARQGRLGSNR